MFAALYVVTNVVFLSAVRFRLNVSERNYLTVLALKTFKLFGIGHAYTVFFTLSPGDVSRVTLVVTGLVYYNQSIYIKEMVDNHEEI